MCSGLIMDRSQDLLLEKFGPLLPDVFSEPKASRESISPKEGKVLLPLPLEKPEVWNVWRSSFDYWLVKQSGADVWESHRLVGLSQTEDAVVATILDSEKKHAEINASYLIGCDGGRSTVRKLIAPAFEKKSIIYLAYRFIVQAQLTSIPHITTCFSILICTLSTPGCILKMITLSTELTVIPRNQLSRSSKNRLIIWPAFLILRIDKIEKKSGCVISDMPAKIISLGRNAFYLPARRPAL